MQGHDGDCIRIDNVWMITYTCIYIRMIIYKDHALNTWEGKKCKLKKSNIIVAYGWICKTIFW